MKKIIIGILAVGCAAAMVAAAGCTPDEGGTAATTLATYMTAYENISEATEITERITLKEGGRTPYEYEKEYVAAGDNYTVTETTTTYNEIITGEEELKQVTEGEPYQVSRKAESVARLNLDESFLESVTITATSLSCKVSDGKLGEVFGITDELEAAVSGAELKITLASGNIQGITVTYASKTYSVTILISFTY